MCETTNILLLSVGSRNKVVQYFKENIDKNSKVIAADCDKYAPALYDADEFYIIPKFTDENYLESIINICKQNKIKGMISLIDPELELISKYKDTFKKIGVEPIVSEYNSIKLCSDKMKFSEWLKNNNINHVQTYDSINKFKKDFAQNIIKFPVFVKPKSGSASQNINKVSDMDELNNLFLRYDNLIIQEYFSGKEFGVDIYVDTITNKLVTLFAKEKIRMRAGETDKSVSYYNSDLNEEIKKLVLLLNLSGPIDIDVFEKDGNFFISEVNPRFGGGYPHAYECGVNFPSLILNNVKNIINRNTENRYKTNVYMMKYNETKIIDNKR